MKRNFGLLISILIVLAGLAVIFCLPARGFRPAQAAAHVPEASIVVNTLEDELNSDGDCSLREAVTAANTNAAVDTCPAGGVLTDTITFDVEGTIVVTSQLSVTAGGPLVIDGGGGITTSGGGTTRVWGVYSGSDLTLRNLTVSDGYITGGRAYAFGAGLYNHGHVTIINCTFSNNNVSFGYRNWGGAIYNAGTLSINNSTISNNKAKVKTYNYSCHGDMAPHGGGIYNGGSLSISNSTISNNSTYADCWVFPYSSEVFTLAEAYGGGISSSGSLSVVNTTFSGNSASADRVGSYGGGIFNTGSVSLVNTIVANSPSGGDCNGTITDNGHNLDSDGTCNLNSGKGSKPHTDPKLGPLQDYGGPTWTQALLAGSPAIDAGDNSHCPSTDQRGVPRPIDGDEDGQAVCDMGAYEYRQELFLFPSNQSGSGALGTTVDYPVQLYNWTLITDTYSLTLGTHAWKTTLSPNPIGPLPLGSFQTFTVTVTVLPEANWYDIDTVVITATSQSEPNKYFASAQVTTRAYAPPQISVDPTSLVSTQLPDRIVTLPLTINNGNGVTLTYDISYDKRIVSDNHWRVSGELIPGWETLGFDDSAWEYTVAPAPVNCGWDHCIFNPDILTMWSQIQYVTIYLRRSFEIPRDMPVASASIDSICDDDQDVYVNGTLVASDWNGVAGPLLEADITNDVLPGANVIAIKANDTAGVCRHICVETNIHFEKLPDWLQVEPMTGTVSTNSVAIIQTNFNSTGLDAGDYTAMLYVDSNDPLHHELPISVTMTVVGIPVTPTAVTISGPESGWMRANQMFTAVTEPISTSLPITYTWQATGQELVIHIGGITDTVTFAWQSPGTQTITVTAANGLGSVMDTHITAITIPPYTSYLPVIFKQQQAGGTSPGAKTGMDNFIAILFSGGWGAVLWLRREVDRHMP